VEDNRQHGTDAVAAKELQRRAASGSVWTAIHTFVSLPIAFVANAVVARSLGVSNFGHLAFLAAVLGLGYAFANFGFNTALIQAGSRAEAGGRRAEAESLLQRGLGFQAIVELPILLAVVIVLTHHDPLWEVLAVATAVILTCLLSGASLSITIENRTAAAAKLSMLLNLALQAASISTALLTGSASAVWAVRTLIPAVAIGFNFLLLDHGRRRKVLRPRLPLHLGRMFWRFSLLSWASGIVGLLVYSRSEIFFLQFFHNAEALGVFALAFGLSQVVTAPADAMLHALLPAVAGVLSEWPERAVHAFERSTRISALLCGGVAAVVIPGLFFAMPFIYGQSFSSAAWLFVPLALISAVQSVNNPVTAFVNGRQRGGLILKAVSVSLLVDVALAVVLIPPFGAWGAVGANIAGQLVGLTWLAATEPVVIGQGVGNYVRLCRAFLIGTAVGAVALAVGTATRLMSNGLAVMSACLVGAALYVLAVHRTQSGLTYEDRNVLVGAMPIRVRPHFARLLRLITSPSAA
jgi:O-antigen/teichoic acid export membrane protein